MPSRPTWVTVSWLHGEAVAAGTVMALEMSSRLGWISAAERDRGIRLLARAGLPLVPPAEMRPEEFLAHMAVDKKVLDGQSAAGVAETAR